MAETSSPGNVEDLTFCRQLRVAVDPGQVLDRALARAGGRNWWTVLLGRVRAQRAWALHREGVRTVDALRHADNYGLASRSRFGFGRWRHMGLPGSSLTILNMSP